MRVRIDPDRVHLFDAATGRALTHPDRRPEGASVPGVADTAPGDAE